MKSVYIYALSGSTEPQFMRFSKDEDKDFIYWFVFSGFMSKYNKEFKTFAQLDQEQ